MSIIGKKFNAEITYNGEYESRKVKEVIIIDKIQSYKIVKNRDGIANTTGYLVKVVGSRFVTTISPEDLLSIIEDETKG